MGDVQITFSYPVGPDTNSRGDLQHAADPEQCSDPEPPNSLPCWRPLSAGVVVTGEGLDQRVRKWAAWVENEA